MPNLHEVIAEHASEWKKTGFPVRDHSTIAAILEFAIQEDGSPRFPVGVGLGPGADRALARRVA